MVEVELQVLSDYLQGSYPPARVHSRIQPKLHRL